MEKSFSKISKIDKVGLCLGCGICEAVAGDDSIKMELTSDGFFHPIIKSYNKMIDDKISKICPGINILNDAKSSIVFTDDIWGPIQNLSVGYSYDDDIRFKGSSGGIVSAIAVYALNNGIVDGVLQIGADSDNYYNNNLKISNTRKEILEYSSSRYAPALVLNKIFDILNRDSKRYLFIGKPCDISGLKNLLNVYPLYSDRIVLFVSIICAGIPSFVGTSDLVDHFNPTFPISNLKYRGDGWPGFFSFFDKNGRKYQKTYNESWGKNLNKHLSPRCKICPDGIGLQADISVGDAWETIDGYPEFEEKEGQSLIISRTISGKDVLDKMIKDKAIFSDAINVTKLKFIQPYQFKRRRVVGARIISYSLFYWIKLNFKNTNVFLNLNKVEYKTIFFEMFGMFKRLIVKKIKRN